MFSNITIRNDMPHFFNAPMQVVLLAKKKRKLI